MFRTTIIATLAVLISLEILEWWNVRALIFIAAVLILWDLAKRKRV